MEKQIFEGFLSIVEKYRIHKFYDSNFPKFQSISIIIIIISSFKALFLYFLMLDRLMKFWNLIFFYIKKTYYVSVAFIYAVKNK